METTRRWRGGRGEAPRRVIFALVEAKVRRLDVSVCHVGAEDRARVEVVQGVGELAHEPQAFSRRPFSFDGSSHFWIVADLVQT